MAEQVRLRETLTPLRVPRVSFAGAEAQARGLGNLAQSLSRMSNFVAQQAESKAVIEGAEYGARNAPTAKQIEEAAADGASLELPGDQTTVYGKAVRKAALSIASDEITALASDKVTRINSIFNAHLEGTMSEAQEAEALSGIGIKDFSVDSFATALDTVAAGYGAVLDEQSPAVARKFRAEMGISNNAMWSTYLDKYVKKQDEQLEFSARDAHQKTFTVETIETLLQTADGNKFIDNLRAAQLSKMSPHLRGGTAIKTFLDNMDAKIRTVATKTVADGTFATEEPSVAIKNIAQGKITNLPLAVKNGIKELRDQGMSFTDIAKDLRTERTAQLQFEDNEQEGVNEQAEKDEKILIATAMEHMGDGNKEAFKTTITTLEKTNPLKAIELTQTFQKAGGRRTISEPDTVTHLRNLGSKITFSDVENSLESLSNEDIKKFRGEAEKFESAEMKTALSVIRGELKIPAEINLLSSDDPNFKQVQLLSKIKGKLSKKYEEAKKEGLAFDGQAIADELLEEMGGEFTEAITAMTIRAGNQTLKHINALLPDEQKVEDGDYQSMINLLKLYQPKQNKTMRPADMRNMSQGQFIRQIEALEKALEASQQ